MPHSVFPLVRTGLALAVLTVATTTQAETPDISSKSWIETARPFVGLGSQGIRVGSAFQVSESFDARVAYSSLKFNKSETTSSSATGSVDLNLSNLALYADWYPFDSSGWRLTGGVQTGTNKLTLSAKPTGSVTIGGTTYTNVNFAAAIDLGSTAPYVGLGYSSRVNKGTGFTFFSDLGVRVGSAKVSLTSTGISQADLDAEKVKIEDKIKVLKYYPVVGFGLGYRW